MMPSDDLIFKFNQHLVVERHWRINGRHYQKTADAWLANMDKRQEAIMPVLEGVYGQAAAALWFQRWRIFFMACSELWGFAGGDEWMVSHYRLKRTTAG
jgi:cyclopropane-fatty-acyl-phospholipid synthase